jgi:DNA invertase Pin-like site-specific DNA recombinase
MAEKGRKRAKRFCCAIYTRKSSDEGLEQEFNSLHAQREACAAFIASQRHEGWHANTAHYDDGGYPGGTMDRPALQRLLGDIGVGKVDVVVVYKIDRLTRSLFDFGKIVEAFDAKGVSFVSVTQQFNTTTSMGRLTLNVLLSFAQFEREVTSERIRDKIAASKQKGMWMGGTVPLGYDAANRKLRTNAEEAKMVRLLFELYLKLGNVRTLQEECQQLGLRTKLRRMLDGKRSGGTGFSCGHLYRILSNPKAKGLGDIAECQATLPYLRHARPFTCLPFTRDHAWHLEGASTAGTNGQEAYLLCAPYPPPVGRPKWRLRFWLPDAPN